MHTPAETDDAAALERILHGRWSCRAFAAREVPEEIIDRLLTLAQRAPSWCNTQPWHVIVTVGEGTERFRAALVEHVRRTGPEMKPDFPMPSAYSGVYQERRRESGWQLYDAVGIARDDRAARARQASRNYELFGAPHVAIVTTAAEQEVYGAIDAGVYIGHFLLAAHALGLAAVPQAALAMVAPFIRDYFDIPDTQKIVAGISFGYPDLSHPVNGFRTSRAGLDEVRVFVRH